MGRVPRSSTTLMSTVAEQLRRRILSGEIKGGTRLRQLDWAERLGVSPTPVREAFAVLAKEGLVRRDPQRGVVAFSPTVDDVVENYDIRLALEPLATELAAKNITESGLRELDDVVARMAESASGADYQQLNREFHRLIYASASRPQLAELIESLRDRFEAYVGLDIVVQPDPRYSHDVREQHESVAAALHARAPKRARKLMEVHLKSNRRHIAQSVTIARTSSHPADGEVPSAPSAAADASATPAAKHVRSSAGS